MQIKTLNTDVIHQLVRPVGQTGPILNMQTSSQPVRPVEQTGQTGPTQNLHKSVNPPLYEL